MASKRPRPLSRREFINKGIVGTTALAGSPWLSAQRADETRHVRGACMHDCPDTCSWT